MTDIYDEFVVFDLKNTGERKQLNIKQEELQNHLDPEQVLIIIREDLRRIYIWKGSKSPVRKRFISSKVAQELQKELMTDPRYHRCKIVSIDQGDELQEFLNAFKLESMEVKERLPDMYYIRNIERQKAKDAGGFKKSRGPKDDYYSPGLEDAGEQIVISSFSLTPPPVKKPAPQYKTSLVKRVVGLSDEEKEKIKKKILELKVPEDYERQNLILGHYLYGAVSKVVEVFGKNIVDITWEEVKKVPKGVMELDNTKFRIYFDEKKGIVEAIEVLRKKENLKLNKLNFDKKVNTEKRTKPVKRELPKIPNGND
ncbi:MAG: hypothetical protein ACFE8E_02095 [Candidatus Hodarchaeota archaeon]